MSKPTLRTSDNRPDPSDSQPEPTTVFQFTSAEPMRLVQRRIKFRDFTDQDTRNRTLADYAIGLVAWLVKHGNLSTQLILHEVEALLAKQQTSPKLSFSIDASVSVSLTKREVEILRLISLHFSNEQIASLLYVSPNTLRTHLRHIHGKAQTTNRGQLLAWWAQHWADYEPPEM